MQHLQLNQTAMLRLESAATEGHLSPGRSTGHNYLGIWLSGILLGRLSALPITHFGPRLAACCQIMQYPNGSLTSAWATVQAAVASCSCQLPVAVASCKSRYMRNTRRNGRGWGGGGQATSTSTQMNFALTPKRLTNKQRSVASKADNLLD